MTLHSGCLIHLIQNYGVAGYKFNHLFFDITDWEEMVNKKISSGDPAFKIKTKIDEFKDKYIGFGG